MKIKYSIYSILFIFLYSLSTLNAQNSFDNGEIVHKRTKRAWEVGIGASVFQFSRIDFTNFTTSAEEYNIDLQLRHQVIGGNLYLARELSRHFYIDVQGTVGFTEQYENGEDKMKTLYMVGPGLQWRLGEYFGSKYIDPYFRVGVSYMKKNFDMNYQGVQGDVSEEMSWVLENIKNKDGVDRNESFPVSLGVGLNTWLNDRFGIGLQGDYLLMPYKDVANSMQGTVRLMWRIGGETKKMRPAIEYVEVEKIVQADPVEIEKIVEVEVPVSSDVCDLFNNIYFEFDKSEITADSDEVLDKIADIMKEDSTKRYLITGYTDAWGSDQYNIGLSIRRVTAVVEALKERGVSPDMMKYRGVGKKVSMAPKSASNEIREGDRKVAVEIITNMDYWNYISSSDR